MEILYEKLITSIDVHLLIINRTKTKCVTFSTRIDGSTDNIELSGDKLQVVKVFKYLANNACFSFKYTEDVAFRL